jgi:hypothetical protein
VRSHWQERNFTEQTQLGVTKKSATQHQVVETLKAIPFF